MRPSSQLEGPQSGLTVQGRPLLRPSVPGRPALPRAVLRAAARRLLLLLRRHHQIQQELRTLKHEAHLFLQDVLANPENRHLAVADSMVNMQPVMATGLQPAPEHCFQPSPESCPQPDWENRLKPDWDNSLESDFDDGFHSAQETPPWRIPPRGIAEHGAEIRATTKDEPPEQIFSDLSSSAPASPDTTSPDDSSSMHSIGAADPVKERSLSTRNTAHINTIPSYTHAETNTVKAEKCFC